MPNTTTTGKEMVSYAQNGEDVMLERVFKANETGFYIDVGAWEPELDSVTKHFYDKGWHGINVEPVPTYYAKLRDQRERDVNLNIALLDKAGNSSLYAFQGTGLSTFRRDHAESHTQAGFEVRQHVVAINTLAAICGEYAKNQAIDFLKIDTEGTELQVLEGGDWTRFRPRVVLIEATVPNSQEPSYVDAGRFLLSHGYLFSYFDGLSRFYVAEEESGLMQCFAAPPNTFDGFVTRRTAVAERRIGELERRLDELDGKLKSAMRKADRYDAFCGTILGRILRPLI